MRQTLDPFDLPARLAQNYDRVERILVRLESGLSTEAAIDRVRIEAVAEIRQNMILAQKALETSLQAAAIRNPQSESDRSRGHANADVAQTREEQDTFKWEGRTWRPNNLFRARVLGEFPTADDETLIPPPLDRIGHQTRQ